MKYSQEELLLMEPEKVYELILNGSIYGFPKGFFKEKNPEKTDKYARLIRYLIEEKLHWSDEEICKNLTKDIFYEYYLSGMLQSIFSNSPYKVIENTYPGKFRPWELSIVPRNYWNKENAREAIVWLIEEKLRCTDEEIYMKISADIFIKNGLGYMLMKIFNGSPYKALNTVYPGKFKPWLFNTTPRNYWNKENAREAIIWLIEEKLKWSYTDICEKITMEVFIENGLGGMIQTVFDGSIYEALNNAYPGKFVKVKNKIQVKK